MGTEHKGIVVRLLAEEDIDRVNAFYNALHPTARGKGQFEWEFLNAPAGKAIYVVAVDVSNGRIIGTQCVIPIDLVMDDGRTVRSGKSEDTLVDPGYRGRGVFELMYGPLFEECGRQGIVAIWGFTSAVKPFKRLGFEVPFNHGQGLFVRDILGAYAHLDSLAPKNGLVKRASILALCMVARCAGLVRRMFSPGLPGAYRMELGTTVHAGADGLFHERIGESVIGGSCRIERSAAFMDWRFLNNPYGMMFWQARLYKDAELLYDVIVSMSTKGVCCVVEERAARALPPAERCMALSEVMRRIERQQQVVLWRAWHFDHHPVCKAEIRAHRKGGWLHLNRGISFVWKALDQAHAPDPNGFILSRLAGEGVS